MALRHEDRGVSVAGNTDTGLSKRVKAWIKQGDTVVCGVIGEGTSIDYQSSWESPFEQMLGSSFDMVNGVLQNTTGHTLKSSLATTQVWQGNRPVTINLSLNFYAISDPRKDVEQAVSALRNFISPELKTLPLSQSPRAVSLNLRGRLLFTNLVITSMSEPYDEVVDASGNRLSASVVMTLETLKTVSKSDLTEMAIKS